MDERAGGRADAMVLRLSCVWELFDVAATWNARRSFPRRNKSHMF